jgi:hypothetical protein
MITYRWFAALGILLCLSSCMKKQKAVTKAYYFWRKYEMTWEERKFLKERQIKKLYTRVLDVDWSAVQGAIPVATNFIEPNIHDLRYYDSVSVDAVPVVFITNKTFLNIDSLDIPQLALRVIRRCLPAYDKSDERYEENHRYDMQDGPAKPHEIQIDCDWTQKTAEKYFAFLRELKSLLPSDSITLSATVRLHQYRYPGKTGVPPVHRGMLMVYNLTDPKRYGNENSIFEEKNAAPYFETNSPYPLPLDIALPAWSWCLIFRNQKFYQIENNLDVNDLKQLSFLKKSGAHMYRVQKDTVFNQLFLREGDEIRAEEIDQATLLKAAELAGKAVNTDSFSVSLFELSNKEIKHYSSESIDQVYHSFY